VGVWVLASRGPGGQLRTDLGDCRSTITRPCLDEMGQVEAKEVGETPHACQWNGQGPAGRLAANRSVVMPSS
jgi:hypothetical protein